MTRAAALWKAGEDRLVVDDPHPELVYHDESGYFLDIFKAFFAWTCLRPKPNVASMPSFMGLSCGIDFVVIAIRPLNPCHSLPLMGTTRIFAKNCPSLNKMNQSMVDGLRAVENDLPDIFRRCVP